jgi:hypothetical protein
VVVYVLNPRTREAEVGGFLSFRPSWSTEGASGQTKIHSETKTKNNNNKKTTTTK